MRFNKNIIASIGAGIEYYDFIIFGHLAGVLSPIFFDKQYPVLSLIYSYVVFAMAYLVRPLGGLVGGLLADKFGRQKTFVYIMLLMAVATFAIGILPTFQSIGVLASMGLIVCRLVQGMSFGAEMPSAIIFITENSEKKDKFLNNSILCSSATLGAILASLVMQILAAKVTVLWRIPFLLGGSLAILVFMLRKISFESINQSNNKISLFEPLKLILAQYKLNFFVAILFFMFSAMLVIAYIYYATYFSTYFNYTLQNVYQFSTAGLVVCALSLPIFAKLFTGKNPYLIAAIIALIFAIYQLLLISSDLLTASIFALGFFMIMHQIFIAAFNSVAYTALAEFFPQNIRATSVSLVYNLSFVLASFLPALIASIIEMNDHYILLWILAVAGVVSFFAAIFYYLNSNKLI